MHNRQHQAGRRHMLRQGGDLIAQCGRTLRAMGVAAAVSAAAAVSFPFVPDALANIAVLDLDHIDRVPLQPLAALAPAYVDEHELRLLAATIWGEARSEGEDGMRAVAHVIVNRVGARFGESIEAVVRAPWQFSVWNRGDPNRRLVMNPERYAASGVNFETWQIAQRVAREVLSGQSIDPTNGALFYHTTAIRPWWSRYGEGARTIGAHIFYRDVPDRRGRAVVTQVAQSFGRGLPIDPPATAASATVQPQDDVVTPEIAFARQQLRAQLAGDEAVPVNCTLCGQGSPDRRVLEPAETDEARVGS